MGRISLSQKQSVKDGILLKLKKEKRLTVAELIEGFNISDVALRRHINVLEKDGLIKSFVVKQALGRPYYQYELTNKGQGIFPSQYQKFSEEILTQLEDIKGKAFVYELLNSRTEKEITQYKNAIEPLDNFKEKVEKLVEIQEDKGYLTELEEKEDGSFVLKQFNCPIYSIASNYSGVCGQEEEMFQMVLKESKVSATSCITKGANCCSFLIENENSI
jgi:DeoR family transcriptional regulator, suf operon transcriptional repressor